MGILITGLRTWMFLSSDFVCLPINSFTRVYFPSTFRVSGAVRGIQWHSRTPGTHPSGASREGGRRAAVPASVLCLAPGTPQSMFAT